MKFSSSLKTTLLALTMSTAVFAGEQYSPSIYIDSTYMSGTMSVISSSNSTDLIGAAYIVGSYVTFYGTEDASGNSFWCQVLPSDAIYDEAIKVATSLKNGSYLSVSKGSSSYSCDYVEIDNSSASLI